MPSSNARSGLPRRAVGDRLPDMASTASPPPLSSRDALFLDFDGTLAPIQPDRNAVFLDAAMMALLERISERLSGAVAVISGRDLRDLVLRAPVGLYRIGGHGLEVISPRNEPPAQEADAPAVLTSHLESLVAGLVGAEIERKGPILAVHYRQNPELREKLEAEVGRIVQSVHGYVAVTGKCVIEAKPAAANKGLALRKWSDEAPFSGRRLVMVGDDQTDEDAFKVVNDLDGVSIKVGRGETAARYRLTDVAAVRDWLGASFPA